MKIPRLEFMARRMRENHRHHPMMLSDGGLYIPHGYWDMKPDDLSYWDDVGFILNGRQFMVYWRHPRDVYKSAVSDLAWNRLEAEHGPGPDPDWLFDGATKNYKRVGKSGKRKKFSSHTSCQPSQARLAYLARLTELEQQIRQEGIHLDVNPSWRWKRYWNAIGVDIIAPVEVRTEGELAELADLVRQLVKQQTTLEARFPGAVYGKTDWLRELEWTRARVQEAVA